MDMTFELTMTGEMSQKKKILLTIFNLEMHIVRAPNLGNRQAKYVFLNIFKHPQYACVMDVTGNDHVFGVLFDFL